MTDLGTGTLLVLQDTAKADLAISVNLDSVILGVSLGDCGRVCSLD